MTAIEKIKKLESVLSDYYVERGPVCHTACISLMAEVHHAQIGPPGTAKSALVYAICRAILGAKIFDILMTRTMNPDELFGPISLKGMEEDDFRRVTDGFMPDCNIFFADEAEKTSDAVRFSMLQIMNERRIRNGKHKVDVPIISMFVGMNKLFEDFETDPIYSRITFRHYTDYIVERGNFEKMIDHACLKGNSGPHTEDIGLTMKDIQKLQAESQTLVKVGRGAKDCLWEIRSRLSEDGFVVDDRKSVWLVRNVCRAEAYWNGRSEVEADDFDILQHCLWNDPKDRQKIRTIILRISNPTAEEANQFIDGANALYAAALKQKNDNKGKDPKMVQLGFLSANREIAAMSNKLADRIKETSGKSRAMLEKACERIIDINDQVLNELRGIRIS